MAKPTKGRLGHPLFVPTEDQRRFVTAMAGTRMTWDEMCLLIINPTTGRPVSKETLGKYFPDELANGKAKLKSVVTSRWMDAIGRGEQWAVQFALRHVCGYKEDAMGIRASTSEGGNGNALTLEFVLPRKYED